MIGAIGVNGDSSCADHNIAWRTRMSLDLDHVPAGVAANGDIIYDEGNGVAHPICSVDAQEIAEGFAKAGSETDM